MLAFYRSPSLLLLNCYLSISVVAVVVVVVDNKQITAQLSSSAIVFYVDFYFGFDHTHFAIDRGQCG